MKMDCKSKTPKYWYQSKTPKYWYQSTGCGMRNDRTIRPASGLKQKPCMQSLQKVQQQETTAR